MRVISSRRSRKGETVTGEPFRPRWRWRFRACARCPLVAPPQSSRPQVCRLLRSRPTAPTPAPTEFPVPGLVNVPRCLESGQMPASRFLRPPPRRGRGGELREQERKKCAGSGKTGRRRGVQPREEGQQAEVYRPRRAAKYSRSGGARAPDVAEDSKPGHVSRETAGSDSERGTWTPQGPPRAVTGLPAALPAPPDTPEPSRAVRPASSPRNERPVPAPMVESYPTGGPSARRCTARVTVEETSREVKPALTAPPR